MPTVPVLAGLWLAEDGERPPGFTLNADIEVGSLHEAVEGVLEAAQADSVSIARSRRDAPVPASLASGAVEQGA